MNNYNFTHVRDKLVRLRLNLYNRVLLLYCVFSVTYTCLKSSKPIGV